MSHIHLDQDGHAWIGDSNVKVIEVVPDRHAKKLSPEELHDQYPHLSLAQIHAALAYYDDYQSELDVEIERRYQEVERMRAQAADQLSRKDLEGRLQGTGHKP